MREDPKYYCVYIMGSLSGTLYIGFSGRLLRRVFQHKFHHFEGLTDRYDVTRLLYWESYDDAHKALSREKQLKGWTRAKKIASSWGGIPTELIGLRMVSVDEVGRGRDASTAR